MRTDTAPANRTRLPRSHALRRLAALLSGLLLALSGTLAIAPAAAAGPDVVDIVLFGPVDSADPVQAGTSYTYDYAVTGANSEAFGVTSSVTLSGASATITGVTTTGGSCTFTATTVTCNHGTVALDDFATTHVTVLPNAAGTVTANVTGSASDAADVNGSQSTTITAPAAADIAVDVTAQPHLGILVPYLTYTLKAHNNGPAAVTSATVTASLPPGAGATNPSAGCTASSGTVTCTYGAIANGADSAKSFRLPLNLLSLGQVSVTGVRTASAPSDNNAANDSDTATCTVISVILATCP
ncbi:hypothetical protein AB0I22_10405 [Streptomyces sp. NPDC050610]|uniref:hypothetical protein n=1 Tax=Streptomyces sp. NPDC050610 TaxID=3157097 RepID=UPI00342A895C